MGALYSFQNSFQAQHFQEEQIFLLLYKKWNVWSPFQVELWPGGVALGWLSPTSEMANKHKTLTAL